MWRGKCKLYKRHAGLALTFDIKTTTAPPPPPLLLFVEYMYEYVYRNEMLRCSPGHGKIKSQMISGIDKFKTSNIFALDNT